MSRPHTPIGSDFARRKSMTPRNRRRRSRYIPTGRKPGRPKKYSHGIRRGHHLVQRHHQEGNQWLY